MARENNMWALLWHGLPVAALLPSGEPSALPTASGMMRLIRHPWYPLPGSAGVYITATDDHSPFYYVLLKSFYHLCGGETHF